MNKLIYSLTLGLILGLVVSCGLGSTAPHLTTEAGLDSVRAIILKEAGSDASFLYLDIAGYTKTDDEVGGITMTDNKEVHTFSTFNWGWVSAEHGNDEFAARPTQRVSDLDFKPALAAYDDVVRQLQERTSDFVRFYIYGLRINVKESGKCTYDVQVLAEKGDSRPTKFGKRISSDDQKACFLFEIDVREDGSFSKIDGMP